jgi:hypothetical protein
MFPYHNRLKQLLTSEQYIVKKESGVFAYRFIFLKIGKSMPIREYRVPEYQKYLKGTK